MVTPWVRALRGPEEMPCCRSVHQKLARRFLRRFLACVNCARNPTKPSPQSPQLSTEQKIYFAAICSKSAANILL